MDADNETRTDLTAAVLAADEQGWSRALFDALRGQLRTEVRRLRIRSPRWVEIDGEHWDDESWDLLTYECYGDRILRALPGLRKHAETAGVGRALLRTIARNYLLDRQRMHAPHRFAVFKKLQSVVAGAARRGVVVVAGGRDGRVDRTSIVRAVSVGSGGHEAGNAELGAAFEAFAERRELRRCLRSKGEEETEVLRRFVDHLLARRCETFVFGDLFGAAVEFAGLDDEPALLEPAIEDKSAAVDETPAILAALHAAIRCEPIPPEHRDRLHRLLDAAAAAVAQNGPGEALNLSAVGRGLGLDRRRAKEGWDRIREIGRRAGLDLEAFGMPAEAGH